MIDPVWIPLSLLPLLLLRVEVNADQGKYDKTLDITSKVSTRVWISPLLVRDSHGLPRGAKSRKCWREREERERKKRRERERMKWQKPIKRKRRKCKVHRGPLLLLLPVAPKQRHQQERVVGRPLSLSPPQRNERPKREKKRSNGRMRPPPLR